jgi:hypothetical protein
VKRFLIIIFIFNSILSESQVVCIYCYDQNDSISQNVNNLVTNGGFENHTCIPNTQQYSFCPNSDYYSCDISNWVCSGGGINTYSNVWNNNFSTIPQGNVAVYFGNGMCSVCPAMQFDTTCLYTSSCVVAGIPPGYPSNEFSGFGGTTGVSLEQTVSGLIPGQQYVLEFWAGGEGDSTTFFFLENGVFAVDVGFGNIFLSCKPTIPFPIHVGTRFIIEFIAASTSHIIKFTNWGHMCNNCTELILDDVRLYTLAELSPSVPACSNLPQSGFYSNQNLCPGSCITFTNISMNTTSCQWSFPGAFPDSSIDINPSNICYTNSGSYDVQLIATNANGSDTLLLSNYITVFPAPSPQSISQSGDTLFAIPGVSSYQWFFNGNIIPEATDYFYVAQSSGDYNLVATDANGCEVEAVINNVIARLTAVLSQGEGVLVFPNPVMNELTVRSSEFGVTSTEISVYNILGEKIITDAQVARGQQPIEIDCRLFPTGVYFIEVSSNEKIYRTKFVKQ